MEYIVHIGSPKTGSSSLQTAFSKNRDALRRSGVSYPVTGLSRYPKSYHNSMRKVLNGMDPNSVGMPEDWIEKFHAETHGADICVLSAESFSNPDKFANPEKIASLLPRERTRVVMYVREPVSHFVAFYKHRVKVKMMTMSLRDFAKSYRLPFLDVAEKWATIFGRKNVVIRLYGRDGGDWDIVTDFMKLFGIILDQDYPKPLELAYELNPGIAGNWLFVRRVLNCFICPSESLEIQTETGELAMLDRSFHGKVPVDQETVDIIVDQSREYLEGLESRFGLSIKPQATLIEASPCPDYEKLAHDFARMLAWAREREAALAPLLERMAGMFAL